MLKIQSLKSNKIVVIGTVIVVLVVAGGVAYAYTSHKNRNATNKPTAQGTPNYDPPTAEDAKRVDDNKKAIVERDEELKNQPAPTSSLRAVKPTITYAGQYDGVVEVGAYVNGIFEDGGTCTATFVNGSVSFSKKVTAIKNASAVDCPVMQAQSSEFQKKGTWSVTVNYQSTTAKGTSDPKTFEVK